jgi:hypothetical protein
VVLKQKNAEKEKGKEKEERKQKNIAVAEKKELEDTRKNKIEFI